MGRELEVFSQDAFRNLDRASWDFVTSKDGAGKGCRLGFLRLEEWG
jgi:hypothetical protein